jgi:5,10-methylenetetrahydromethanopterin reductase
VPELGLGLQTDKRPEEYVQLARLAEDAGFDVVSTFHDLLFQPAIAPLVLIAQATERVRVGPAALNPYTLHPVEIAGQTAALDLISNGRAYLGLVKGAWLDELGLEEARPLTALREAVEIVRRLFSRDLSGFEGERFSLAPGRGFEFEPLRAEVPLMLGTWGPRTAAYAGEVAHELKLGGTANPDLIPIVREWIGNDEVGIVVGAVTAVDEDGDAARARARVEVGRYLPIVGKLDPTFEGREPPLDRVTIAGTPEEVIRHAERLFAAGVKRIDFGAPQGVKLLAERVVPWFR